MMTRHLPFAIFILIMTAIGAWVGVMWLDNEPPYVYDAANSRIIPDPAPQGAMVSADWALLEVKRVCPGSVQRFFRDKTTGQMAATLDTTEVSRAVKVGDNRLPRAFQLPPKLPPVVGYSALVCFECNKLQRLFPLCIPTPEIVFRVIQ